MRMRRIQVFRKGLPLQSSKENITYSTEELSLLFSVVFALQKHDGR